MIAFAWTDDAYPHRRRLLHRPPAARAYLDIDVYPDESTVYVDGRDMGDGDRKVEVAPGAHTVYAEHRGHRTAQVREAVAAGETEDVECRLVKPFRFHLSTNVALNLGTHIQVGPTVQLGYKILNHYVGFVGGWSQGSISESELETFDGYEADPAYSHDSVSWNCTEFYGSAVMYGYTINVRDKFILTPAVTAGLWKELSSANVKRFSAGGSAADWDYLRKTDLYFGGLRLRLDVGPRYFFFCTDAEVLFGTGGVKFAVRPGICVYI